MQVLYADRMHFAGQCPHQSSSMWQEMYIQNNNIKLIDFEIREPEVLTDFLVSLLHSVEFTEYLLRYILLPWYKIDKIAAPSLA